MAGVSDRETIWQNRLRTEIDHRRRIQRFSLSLSYYCVHSTHSTVYAVYTAAGGGDRWGL